MSIDTDKKTPNVPNLRFPEFTDSYTKYRCSDFLVSYSTNSLSWDKLTYETNVVSNLHYGLIHGKAPLLIDLSKYQLPTIEKFDLKNYTLIKNGDIVFADASEDTNEIFKPVEFINTNQKQVIAGLHTIHCRDIKNITAIGYKGFLFSSFKLHKQVRRLAQGAKIYSVNPSNLNEIYVNIPDLLEQEKIVSFLSLINERINTQNKIIRDLETQKNIINNKLLFNNTNCLTSLKEIAQLKNGYAFKSKNYVKDGQYKIITISNVTGENHISFSRTNCINAIPKDIQEHQKLNIGDILVSLTGNVGRVSKVGVNDCLLNQRVGLIEPYHQNDRDYLFHCLSSKKFVKQMINKAQGAAQLNIGKDDVESFKIPRIVNKEIILLLDLLDKKLEIEKIIYYFYNQQKECLLQNMFI